MTPDPAPAAAEAMVWVCIKPDGTVPAAAVHRGQTEQAFRADVGEFKLPAFLVPGPVTLGSVLTMRQEAYAFRSLLAQPALAELRAENERLREALEFYARPFHWSVTKSLTFHGPAYKSVATRDYGRRARAALEPRS